jgi:hypothetical protein
MLRRLGRAVDVPEVRFNARACVHLPDSYVEPGKEPLDDPRRGIALAKRRISRLGSTFKAVLLSQLASKAVSSCGNEIHGRRGEAIHGLSHGKRPPSSVHSTRPHVRLDLLRTFGERPLPTQCGHFDPTLAA